MFGCHTIKTSQERFQIEQNEGEAGMGIGSKVFLEHILGKPAFKSPPNPPYVPTSDTSRTSKCRFENALLIKWGEEKQFFTLEITEGDDVTNGNSSGAFY